MGAGQSDTSHLGDGVKDLLDNFDQNTPDKGTAKPPLATRSPLDGVKSTERNHNTMHQTDLDYVDDDEHQLQQNP